MHRRPRRFFCFALLLYQALWLNVVVPGHTRGAVTLPGTGDCPDCAAAAAPRACCPHAPEASSLPPAAGRNRPGLPVDRAAHCAICSFAATLTLPPSIDLTPTPRGLLRRLPPPAPAAAPSLPPRPGYHGRAPPAIALPAC